MTRHHWLVPVFRRIARMRAARVLHPKGVVLTGELTAARNDVVPLSPGTQPVTVRLSKALGTGGGLPDILGLAVRIPGQRWDVTLSTCGRGRIGRLLPLPARSWARGLLGTIACYRRGDLTVWLFAAVDVPVTTTSLQAVVEHLPFEVVLSAETSAGRRVEAARIAVSAVAPDVEIAYDPMINLPAGLEMAPRWLRRLREPAYDGSRQGRSAPPPA